MTTTKNARLKEREHYEHHEHHAERAVRVPEHDVEHLLLQEHLLRIHFRQPSSQQERETKTF